MIQKIVILGAGAHAAELEGYVNENNLISDNKIEILGYYDDNFDNWKKYKLKSPLLGGIKDFDANDNIRVLLGIANVAFRRDLISFYKNKNVSFISFVHHSSFVFDTAEIGFGNVICRNCVIGPNVKLGDYNTVNSNTNIGHDSIIGNNNVICPNNGFSGSTSIGNDNFFSLNSCTIPGIIIGDENTIAPGMIIEKNIKNNTTVFHKYKEKILFQPK